MARPSGLNTLNLLLGKSNMLKLVGLVEMMWLHQSPREMWSLRAPEPKMENWSFCKYHNIGTWNVRTMNTGKLDIVKREMERTRVEILGISELKWTEMGHFQSDEYKVFFLWPRSCQEKWSRNHLWQRHIKMRNGIQANQWSDNIN